MMYGNQRNEAELCRMHGARDRRQSLGYVQEWLTWSLLQVQIWLKIML